MKATAQNLSNNILIRSKKEKIDVTPMKLQKLLYYVCVKYVKMTGFYPVVERFETWPYGPVIPSIYVEFKDYGSSPIREFSKDAKGKSKMVDEDANPMLTFCIDCVWNQFKNLTGIQLSKKTHLPTSGWYKAYQRGNDIITLEDMKEDGTI